jgi:hypothetical protein
MVMITSRVTELAHHQAAAGRDRLVDHQAPVGRQALDLLGRQAERVVDLRNELDQNADVGQPVEALAPE